MADLELSLYGIREYGAADSEDQIWYFQSSLE